MYFDNESAEFYAEKRFDFRIPRNEGGLRTIRSGRANQYDSPSSQSFHAEVPPSPSYQDTYNSHNYTSPLSTADEQFNQQQYAYQNQSHSTYNRYQNPNTKYAQSKASTDPSGSQFYTRTEKSALKRKSDTQSVKFDANLPNDLKKLLQALFCELCNVKLNSPITAKIHYESKVHEKKVRHWLDEWSKRTGNPIPEIQSASKDSPVGPKAFHCNSCDIPLTSQAHAQSHYLGKKHQMVIAGKSKPKGSGYYDEAGVWHKTPIPKNDDNPRFGIGTSFYTNSELNATKVPPVTCGNQDLSKPQVPPPELTAAVSPSKKAKVAPGERQLFYCKLCDISTTSEQLLQMHYNGAKHERKLRAQFFGGSPAEAAAALVAINTSGANRTEAVDGKIAEKSAIVGNVTEPNSNPTFYAYRTPSGQFYCPTCDISITSDTQLKQHLESKKHIRRMQEKKKVLPQKSQ